MMKLLYTFLLFALALPLQAQRPNYGKMSSMLRQIAHQQNHCQVKGKKARSVNRQEICAFIRITQDADEVLEHHSCRKLAQFGDIYIASIPLNRLNALSLDNRVTRIEANRTHSVHTDILAGNINALPVYQGEQLPQAYTGKGVVMGVMDIGFDLTHPNFYDSSATNYRIKQMWDHVTTDTLESDFYVGRDYIGTEELLALGHSYDGIDQTHGTHTLGIAAGSGYNTPYRGIAYESDICLVANASNEDLPLIDSMNVYKYTYATDALGFKYIFDYADSVGKPCVISFSEGSPQDFQGYDVLYYAILDSLVGPGHIIVASAGNNGDQVSYFHKEPGRELAGNFLYSTTDHVSGTIKTDKDIDIRTVIYHAAGNDTIIVPTQHLIELPDSELVDTFYANGLRYILDVYAYPSCYEENEMCYDYTITVMGRLGSPDRVSLELIGREADVHFYKLDGFLLPRPQINPLLTDGEKLCNIHSPSSAPNVICVGATGYRTEVTNYLGEQKVNANGTNGERSSYSSVGPTYDGRIKPDVVAPGTNVISSYSSYYLEKHPDASDIKWDVAHFDFNGRTYAWNTNTGTSMSTPAVGGAIALWLQANPRLTPQDIMEVFSRTCRRVDDSLDYPNIYYGYGQIDVYKGLLDVLNLTGIEGISQNQPKGVEILPIENGKVKIVFGEYKHGLCNVQIYSLAGVKLFAEKYNMEDGSITIDVKDFPQGIYAIQVNGPTAEMTGSTLVRL